MRAVESQPSNVVQFAGKVVLEEGRKGTCNRVAATKQRLVQDVLCLKHCAGMNKIDRSVALVVRMRRASAKVADNSLAVARSYLSAVARAVAVSASAAGERGLGRPGQKAGSPL
jgi:hypothetical protein